MENKIKYANIEQIRLYTNKKGEQRYKYMVHQEKWNEEKKRYDGWECITVYSDEYHIIGQTIAYKWEYNQQYRTGRYIEYKTDEELPF